jgi:hypothetical protein
MFKRRRNEGREEIKRDRLETILRALRFFAVCINLRRSDLTRTRYLQPTLLMDRFYFLFMA